MRALYGIVIIVVATSGCTPKARPYGMGVGAATAIAGTLLAVTTDIDDCPDNPIEGIGCAYGAGYAKLIGVGLAVLGAALFIGAVVSPGEPEPDIDPRPVPTVPAANGDPLVRARPAIRLGFD